MKHRVLRLSNITTMLCLVAMLSGFYLTAVTLFGIIIFLVAEDGCFAMLWHPHRRD